MLIAKPCHNSEEIADFINAYGEFLEGWGIVEGTNPPVIVQFLENLDKTANFQINHFIYYVHIFDETLSGIFIKPLGGRTNDEF